MQNNKLQTCYQHDMNVTSPDIMSTKLKIITYNIQGGLQSSSVADYVLSSWKYLIPDPERRTRLDQIADVLRDFDIVALQEVDSGSLRTGFINQVEYLALQADMPFWHTQLNRNLGKLGQMSNGLLSRIEPSYVSNYKLPSTIPGRGAMMFQFGDVDSPLIVINLHLSLSAKARSMQLDYISELITGYQHVIVIGDMNCHSDSDEMTSLMNKTNLSPTNYHNTFPSWSPKRSLDQILISPGLKVEETEVLPVSYSDHLPFAIEVTMPSKILLS